MTCLKTGSLLTALPQVEVVSIIFPGLGSKPFWSYQNLILSTCSLRRRIVFNFCFTWVTCLRRCLITHIQHYKSAEYSVHQSQASYGTSIQICITITSHHTACIRYSHQYIEKHFYLFELSR